MDRDAALGAIRTAVERARKTPADITPGTDLVEEGVLDSLDAMVFLMELEDLTGVTFPEDADLVELGAFRVPVLLDRLVGAPAA
ncbi:MAG: acyl carrier protein [Thermoleophilia bacterium]